MYRSILWTSFPEQYSLCDAFDPSSSSSEKLTSVHQTTPCSIVEGINNVLDLTKSPHTKLEQKVSLNHQLFLRIYLELVSLVGGCLATLMLCKILQITVIDVRKCYGDVLLEFLLNYTQEGH